MTATFKIDPVHTDVTFSAKHLMVTTVRGNFGDVDGELRIDESDPTRSTGEIRIAAASLSTGFEARDQHLRSGDFFDAENHPTIVFRATGIESHDSDTFAVTGELTIRGTTRPVTFEAEFLGFYPGMDGSRRIGLAAHAKLHRKDWGLNWNMALETGGVLVSDVVKLEIDIAATESVATPAEALEGAPDAKVAATEQEVAARV